MGYEGRIIPGGAGGAGCMRHGWKEQAAGGSPSSVAVTNAVTGAVEPAFMSSPNSAQMMRDPQSRLRYEVGEDGSFTWWTGRRRTW
jgi:hypothetical protein